MDQTLRNRSRPAGGRRDGMPPARTRPSADDVTEYQLRALSRDVQFTPESVEV